MEPQSKPYMEGRLKASPRAKQFRGVPDYPTETLVPVLSHECAWAINDALVTDGLMFEKPGAAVVFAPIPVPRMRMLRFLIVMEYFAPFKEVMFGLRLRFRLPDGNLHEIASDEPILCPHAHKARWGVEIPQEQLDRSGTFACTLFIDLMTENEDHEEVDEAGNKVKKWVPLIVRNVWAQVDD